MLNEQFQFEEENPKEVFKKFDAVLKVPGISLKRRDSGNPFSLHMLSYDRNAKRRSSKGGQK